VKGKVTVVKRSFHTREGSIIRERALQKNPGGGGLTVVAERSNGPSKNVQRGMDAMVGGIQGNTAKGRFPNAQTKGEPHQKKKGGGIEKNHFK